MGLRSATTSPARLDAASALAATRPAPASLIDAPLLATPPVLSYSTQLGISQDGSNTMTRIGIWTSLTNPKLYRWDDPKVQWIGGVPKTYTTVYNTSGAAMLGAHTLKNKSGAVRLDMAASSYAVFDLRSASGAFEVLLFGDTNQYFRVWINGRPHAVIPEPVQVPGSGGQLYLLRVAGLDTSLDRNTIMFEMSRCLLGGFVLNGADSLLPSVSLGGAGHLILGDSYGIGQGLAGVQGDSLGWGAAAWPWRYSRRLGFSRTFIYAYPGTGVLCDAIYNPATPGHNYLDRLIAIEADLPDDIGLITFQGSTNDGNFCTQDSTERAALAQQLDDLFDFARERWPDAEIELSSTVRAMAPTANDLVVSGIYKARAEARSDVHYIDQVTEAWFAGTGHTDTTTPAPLLIQDDDSHPKQAGQNEHADRRARAITEVVPALAAHRVERSRPLSGRSVVLPVSSDVLATDPLLRRNVEANTVYDVKLLLRFDSNATENFQLGFALPAGATLRWGTDGALSLTEADALTIPGQGAGTVVTVVVTGVLSVGATAGLFAAKVAKQTLSITNLFDNPSFETDTSGLVIVKNTESTMTLTSSTDWAAAGTHSAKLIGTLNLSGVNSGFAGVKANDAGSARFPCTPGSQYLATCTANVTDAPQSGAGLFIEIFWFDAGGAQIGNPSQGPLGNFATGVQTLSISATAPAGAVSFVAQVLAQSATDADTYTVYLDQMVVAELLPTNVQPGSVLALTPWSAV